MSLLLDALKRAEQEKQLSRGNEREPATAREPVITPAAANAPSVGAMELQPLQPPGAAPSPPPAPRSEAAAHAAQAVFQAKQAPLESNGRNRGVIWAVLGVIVVVVAAATAYVWTQVKQLSPRVPAASYSAKRPPSAPVPEPASAASHVEVPPAALPPPARLDPPHAPVPAPSPREALVKELLEAPATAAPPAAIEMAPAARAPRVLPEVSAGYEALRTGDLATARRQYQAALANDPRNVDALLGLATAEARGGNRPAALGQYRRVLEVDPRNATALAGLAALADEGRAEALEPQLLADIQRYPAQPALRVALGNLYAAQNRWSDAQAAYFEAHRLDPANADIAFNLAVALDQLGKAKVAAGYYRRAIEAARGQPAQFDPAVAARRAGDLEASAER